MSDANGVGGRHKLTRMQDYQLMSWVSCQRDRLQREHPTQREIAAEASKELGFSVTRANVVGCLDALGITIERPKAVRATGGGAYLAAVREQVAAMQSGLQALEVRCAELTAALTSEREQRRRLEARVLALETGLGLTLSATKAG